MNDEFKELIQKIADTYGYEAQSRQCIEEMAELTQAINKLWRARNKFSGLFCEKERANIVEELTDVQIMLWQMQYLLKIKPLETEIKIKEKLLRQAKRIKAEGRKA